MPFGHTAPGMLASLLALLVAAPLGACTSESEAPSEAGPLPRDGGEHDAREPDPAVDLDAGTGDAEPSLDARVTMDAHLLAAEASVADAALCFPPVPESCAPRAAPAVSCGASVCEGDAPLCCRHDGDHAAPSCVSQQQDCMVDAGTGNPDIYLNTSECDETSDCGPNEFCLNGRRKGGPMYHGGECHPVCGPTGAFGARQELGPYMYQLCTRDCECVEGLGCLHGKCRYGSAI